MGQLAEVSRAGYYRRFREQAPEEEAMEVRAAVQQVALEHRRRYGYRRVTAELRRRGMAVNPKRVARLMQEDNLLALRRKAWISRRAVGWALGGNPVQARRTAREEEYPYSSAHAGWALDARPEHLQRLEPRKGKGLRVSGTVEAG
jgi:hypothetical protein